ncbi:TonB-dependent receptor [Phenylobacterium sp.]|jgi:outer membrane receptor protein involved in Fe transport|uniref:TonB-dependent receptor n=1 Tax=Phenylobacterium sp. TaxID=1871053 RepID=UPI002E336FD2|nr:TonB-dependent receptor [Phenylobacterium sp.]HEX4712896.1 TonB-dependent receptor [Phenylobacterium sp.]
MACGAGGQAAAAAPAVRFHIEPKATSEALLDVALQANVTLIGAAACAGYSQERFVAAMTVEQALDRLLPASASCTWRMIAPDTIEIVPISRAALRPAAPVTVSEVLVTTTKRVRDPRQLAVAVTAVRGLDLQAAGASDAADSGAHLGMLSTNLGPGRDKLLLRGLSDGAYTGRARSTVATYLDDIPLNYNAPDPDLRLSDVDRVEIARGPQGALYGAGFLSGVYRIVSNKPDLSGPTAEARVTGAVTEDGAPSGAIEGYINSPIWGDGIGIRLSAYDEVEGGYLDDVRLHWNNANRTQREGARLTMSVEPDTDWTFLLTGATQHLRSDDTQYTTAGMGLRRDNRIAEPHVNDITLGTAKLKRSWGWGELTSSTGVVRHSYGSLYDATAAQDMFTAFADTSAYTEQTDATMLVEDLYLTSRGGGRFQWLVGVYGSSTTEHSPSAFLAQHVNLPSVPVYSDDRRDWIDELAAYGEVSYELIPGWTLALGGRAFSIHTRTKSHVESEVFQPRDLDRSATYQNFSPKVSLQHQFAGGALAYAVYSEGYRAGGFNSGGPEPLPAANETYAPDRLRNYELGLKLQALDRRLSFNSAVFYDLWNNIQTDQYRPSGIPFTTNAGDARILGVETELGYRSPGGLSVELNGRYTQTRTFNPNPNFLSLLIDGLPNAPPFSGGALVSYQRPVVGDWQMRLAGETVYVGRSRVTFDTQFPEMGGYVRAKLMLELRRRGIGAQLFVTNPTNAFDDTFAFGNQFNPTLTPQVTPQRPRTFGLTLFAAY